MDLNILTTDMKLIDALKEAEFNVISITSIEDIKSENILVISSGIYDYQMLHDLDLSEIKHAFYVLDENFEPGLEKMIKALCDSKGINFVAPRLTEKQIVRQIQETINPSISIADSNVFTYFSAVPNIGTTSTVLSTSKALTKYTNAKVGVLILNAWDCGTDQLQYNGDFLNNVKGKLTNKLFSLKNEDGINEFLSHFHMEETERLYILGGNQNTKMERLYTTDEINYLIQISKKIFDVVLIDAGSHFDNANMIQSLKESDIKFLLVNQQRKSIKKFNQIYDDVLYPLGYKKTDFLMIVNEYKDDMILPSTKDIYSEIKVPLVTTIEKVHNGYAAETAQKTLYEFEDISYTESINALLKVIASNCSLQINTEPTRKRKRLFGIGG